jgi:lipoteichoic acid synthase
MQHTHTNRHKTIPVPLIPILVACLAALVKSYLIPRHLGVEDTLVSSLTILRNDFPFLGMICFLLFSRCSLRLRSMALFCEVISSLAVTWYMIDVVLILSLNARVPFNEIINYSREGTDSLHDMAMVVALFLLIVIAILRLPLLRLALSPSPLRLILTGALMFVPPVNSMRGILQYATPIFFEREHRNLIALPAPSYSPEELATFGAASHHPAPFNLGGLGQNIILLVVESLTASDSFATSGLFNLVPRFDAISAKGTLFKNFFANGVNSEMGMISFLTEVPPLRYPGGDFTTYRSFAHHPSVVTRMKASGYSTSYLSGATLTFLRRGEFYHSIGFDSAEGTETAPEFQGHAKHILNSVNDALLYEASLSRVKRLLEEAKPFFFVITTVSSHLPYSHPITGNRSEKEVWEYCDTELEAFYNRLVEVGFFKDGILIITGDHRKMIPANPAEIRRYGDSVASRIGLAIIGKGVPAGNVDHRWLDQSHLFRALPSLFSEKEASLQSYTLLSEPYIAPLFGENPAFISVFSAHNRGMTRSRLRTRGPDLAWTKEDAPPDAKAIESEVHEIRAHLQWTKTTWLETQQGNLPQSPAVK